MSGISRNALRSGIAAIALGWTGGALAQAAIPPAATTDNAVEMVVVTASRRSETIQSVGGGVTALTANDLSQMHANTFADFAATVPSLSFQANSPTNNLVAIRGVASSTAELGSAVGIYLDDVPLGASTQFGLGSQSFNINLFDMERVEILDGPQGTLYGANALGGAVKYVAAKPDLGSYDARAEVEGSHTDHGSYNDGLRVMSNIPLFADKVALRIDGLQEYDSGYTQDPTHGRRNLGAARTYGGRISLFAQLTPDLDVRLGLFSQNIAANGLNVGMYDINTHQPVAGGYNQSFALRQPSDNSVTLYSGVLNWDLHWAKLTSITGYQINHGTYDTDVSAFYDPLFFIESLFGVVPASLATLPYDLYVNTNTKKFTQEVRLASPDNKDFEWVIGGFYTREITDELVDLLNGAAPGGNLPAPISAYGFYGFLPSSYREIAGYADATYYFTKDFDLTLGVRYSAQHQMYRSNIWWVLYGPPYGKVYPYGAPSDQSVTTYLINPRYRLNENTMLYAKAASGYRPGGPNFFPPPFPATFQPDSLWNYELGEKSTLLDGKATVNFDIYDIEWQGIQTTENVNGINQLVNAGNARVEGAETYLSYRLTPQLLLSGSAAYTDAYLTTPAPVLGVLKKGARLPLSPRYNFTISGTYNFDLGDGYSGAVNVADVYVGDRTSGYAGSATNVLYKMPSYNTVNLNLALYLPHNIELDGYVKNMFDTRGQISAGTLANVLDPTAPVPVTLSLPRTVGLVLKVGLDK
ncbi:MAG: TonB-dependent receptor [Alphaproteobacteria bacterium]|nr:TonB-dependent receptor [Alphaproteobacteria bacterium]MDE2012129.1 TonB-dependent receptor [Alphaproteobacteria bacterium]MDE2072293.1 TonB-dependent receptor [Alphaproteobacteria bacterium]MDE2353288.1 TonB-dependent receptor [Alphaproteobacteria bacterium]